MWSLTSLRAGRTSGAEKFRSSAEKDFFNGIGTKRTRWTPAQMPASERIPDIAKFMLIQIYE
jgi:hypothetical protein